MTHDEKGLQAMLQLQRLLIALLALSYLLILVGCNTLKKTASIRQQSTDSTTIRKSDSTAVSRSNTSSTNEDTWWKVYGLLQQNQNNQPVPSSAAPIVIKGDPVYIPQPYLLAEGGTKSSSNTLDHYDSTNVLKVDSATVYRKALDEEKNKSKSSFSWYWLLVGGVLLLGIGFFLPQFSIVRK